MYFLEEALYIKDCGCLPVYLARFANLAYNGIRVVVPIVLIITGIIALMSSMMAQKEDDIGKAQAKLIRKVVASVLVFLVMTLVQFTFELVSNSMSEREMPEDKKKNIWHCVSYLLNQDPPMETVATCDIVKK